MRTFKNPGGLILPGHGRNPWLKLILNTNDADDAIIDNDIENRYHKKGGEYGISWYISRI